MRQVIESNKDRARVATTCPPGIFSLHLQDLQDGLSSPSALYLALRMCELYLIPASHRANPDCTERSKQPLNRPWRGSSSFGTHMLCSAYPFACYRNPMDDYLDQEEAR